MEKVRRTPASLKKMVEIFGMEILHKGRDFVAVTAGEGGLYDLNVGGAEEWFDAYTGRPIGRGPQLKLNLKPAETFTACRKILLDKIHTGGNAR